MKQLFLYALSKKGTYCVRAPNTLCSESIFSTMKEMDPWGQGVLTKEGVEKHISDFTSITAMKMKNDKPFFIRTKKDAAYPSVSTENDISVDDPLNCFCRTNGWIRCIIPKDHFLTPKQEQDEEEKSNHSSSPI
ncbi:Hypothetical predicted protein [Mytilus galloprovincialis]|uniref:Uncharacterized protein n=1 Tax=Mytilus galloprovincialis TaxID=29158 RepID=A0A8B6D0E0_MYTGA|nr:Hypothetical predicted protein [Mytilus galloprovincialis]